MAERTQDLFMQFATVALTTGADSTTLTEEELPTGLTIRGGYAWLVHFVEVGMPGLHAFAADNVMQVALSVRQGESAMPEIDDAGTISKITASCLYQTSGVSVVQNPMRDPFLPPVIICNPKLSMYWQSTVNDAAVQSTVVRMRIGYTTVAVDKQTYMEIAETWEVV